MQKIIRWLAAFCLVVAARAEFRYGVASVDITPNAPVRLSGYAARTSESEGVSAKIYAKALALEQTAGRIALMLTIDTCAISKEIRDEIVGAIERRHFVPAERIVIFSSHTHSAPFLKDSIANIFVGPLIETEQANVDRYTRELIGKVLEVAAQALGNMEVGRLYFGQGETDFAKNRRTEGGPVDHAVPLIAVKDEKGAVRAILANYACHCTTLGGNMNKVHPDWAGLAQTALQARYPGATALVSIGCGADSNPSPRGTLELVEAHGEKLAAEVHRVLEGPLKEITSAIEFRAKALDLPFEPLPTREAWEKRAAEPAIVGYHARRNLERLERGENLPTTLPYLVQTWNFGGDLAMVFLPGEVVVDYALRLKSIYDPQRLWVSGYANWVPCYIPSQRILKEGGYEAEQSLWYYDQPARLSLEIEEMIISTVQELLPKTFLQEKKSAEMPGPRKPQASLEAIRTVPELKVELMASEPLVMDPVAIDWSADGKLWVVEMRDFPQGIDGHWRPGGRVSVLEDPDETGAYRRATVFIEGIPFPTGVTCWNGGALICAAPEILFARDTNGDGKADEVRKLFTGFATDNYQARVNSLALGLDGWFYGANGLIGGMISGGALKTSLNINGRDFRFRPDTGEFETAAGLTQQGRVRDDFGRWFGCDNSTLLWQYPIGEDYWRRNPHVVPSAVRVSIIAGQDPNQLYPVSETLERFNDPGHANRVTSACGLGLYRDEALGAEFAGNAFVGEPVHNLVRRLKLEGDGAIYQAFKGEAKGEEFLASRDSWFRPVQLRTGPDGGLWVVDMYRLVVEHPRWITPERLETLELRAGEDKGRIYRVTAKKQTPRKISDLTKMGVETLATRLDDANGTERDRVHLELVRRKDREAGGGLGKLLGTERPAVAVQALAVLRDLELLEPEKVVRALRDSSPEVRAFGLKMAEDFPNESEVWRAVHAVSTEEASVRLQAILSLGNVQTPESTHALATILPKGADRWMRGALVSGAAGRAAELASSLLELGWKDPELLSALIQTAIATGEGEKVQKLLLKDPKDLSPWKLSALEQLSESDVGLKPLYAWAAKMALEPGEPLQTRVSAVRALARAPGGNADEQLRELLQGVPEAPLLQAGMEVLAARGGLAGLLAEWNQLSPALRRGAVAAGLARADMILPLLRTLEKQGSLGELSLDQKQALKNHKNAGVRAFADKAFTRTESRAEILKLYRTLPTGEARRGAELFQVHCTACHQHAGQGNALGPNLAALTDRSDSFLLTAILDPNAAVETRYLSYTVHLKDGREFSGLITEETQAGLLMLAANGARTEVLRKEVTALRASQLSLMPEGFEQALDPAQMADLLAFLREPIGR